MKLMIASDIHGSAYYTARLLEALEREAPERLLLLGDLLYHGPRNDLPRDYAPKEVIALLNGVRDCLLCVRGNCDAEVDQMVLDFPILADSCLLYWNGRGVFATHGHLFHKQAPPPLRPGELLLYGHTHVPAWEPFGRQNLYLNPGSVSLPKKGSPHGYLLMDDGGLAWKELDGRVYHRLERDALPPLPADSCPSGRKEGASHENH